jgi:hypothetical protein
VAGDGFVDDPNWTPEINVSNQSRAGVTMGSKHPIRELGLACDVAEAP